MLPLVSGPVRSMYAKARRLIISCARLPLRAKNDATTRQLDGVTFLASRSWLREYRTCSSYVVVTIAIMFQLSFDRAVPSLVSEPARSVSAAICNIKYNRVIKMAGGFRARLPRAVTFACQQRRNDAADRQRCASPLLTSRIPNLLTMLGLIFQRFNYHLIESSPFCSWSV